MNRLKYILAVLLFAIPVTAPAQGLSDGMTRLRDVCLMLSESAVNGEEQALKDANSRFRNLYSEYDIAPMVPDSLSGVSGSAAGHIIYLPEFFDGYQKGDNVYLNSERMLREFQRGERLLYDYQQLNLVIAKDGTARVCLRAVESLELLAIAEPYGRINMSVHYGGEHSYDKEGLREGLQLRQRAIKLPKKETKVTIELTNKSGRDISVTLFTD